MGCFLCLVLSTASLGKAPSHLASRKEWRFEFGDGLISWKKIINKKRLVLEAAVPLIHSLTLLCRSMMWALGDVSTEPTASLLQSHVPQRGTSDRTVTVKPLKVGDMEGKGRGVPLPILWVSMGLIPQKAVRPSPRQDGAGPVGRGKPTCLATDTCSAHNTLDLSFPSGSWLLCSCSLFQETREAESEEGKSRSCLALMLPLSSGMLLSQKWPFTVMDVQASWAGEKGKNWGAAKPEGRMSALQ